MKCPYCGKNIADDSLVCIFCETMLRSPARLSAPSAPAYPADSPAVPQAPRYAPQPAANGYAAAQPPIPRPEDAEPTDYLGSRLSDPPLSVGGFIGTLVVAMLPLAGLIVLLVWICSAKTNANRRNLSVALLIFRLFLLFFFCGAALSYYLLNFPAFYLFW